MNKSLLIVAHPNLQKSRINKALLEGVQDLAGLTAVDLYGQNPEAPFEIDIEVEQQRLIDHDVIVLQFPFYWYSAPAILKQWVDNVLTYGFAFGSSGDKLKGKNLMIATSTGGPASTYSPDGRNRFTMEELLRPFEATANLTGMNLLPPSLFQCEKGLMKLDDDELNKWVADYRRHLSDLIS